MRNAMALGLVLVTVLATPAFAQSLVGRWTTTIRSPGSPDITETLNVAKTGDGYSVNSKAVGVPPGTPEAGPGTDVVLDGDHFSFKRSLATPNGPLSITYTGVVAGDAFTGTVDIGIGKAPYTGVRMGVGG